MPIDFKKLNQILLRDAQSLLPAILSNGRFIGNEFVVGDLQNKPGDSLRFNIAKGCGKDFATGETFGDVIDLYAKAKGVSQLEAARQLANRAGYDLAAQSISSSPALPPPPELKPEPPPEGETCHCIHPKHGSPSQVWEYKDADGCLLFYVARYDTEDGKQMAPWSWVNRAWAMKGWAAPRPLYNLHALRSRSSAPVIVVEGERCADAVSALLPGYNVITWSNGALAWKRSDWKPVFGAKYVLLWQDADKVGQDAMLGIAELLKPHCPLIRCINTDGWSDGYDAADLIGSGGCQTANELVSILKARAHTLYDSTKPVDAEAPAAVPAEITVEDEREPSEPEPPVVVKADTVNAENAIVQVNQYSSEDAPAEMPESTEYWIGCLGLAVQKNKTPINNLNNAIRVIEGHPRYQGVLAYDHFYRRLQIKTDTGYRDWDDMDIIFFTDFMQGNLGLAKISTEDVYKAARAVGHKNSKNEPKDWMESLQWDGVSRLDTFFIDYYVAENSEYMRAVSKNFLVGMVARIYQPGCELHNMVILEGPQGIFKSRSLKAIGGKWYAGTSGLPDNKDFFINLQGKMLIEISELDSFRKVENTLVKKLLTDHFDRYRDPYGKVSADNYRTCIFVGTTNEDEYLRDHTGGRRFWPVRVGTVHLEDIIKDRDQLFAEAVHRYKAGEKWWEVPSQAAEEQELRRISDEWESIIEQYLFSKTETTVLEIAIDALKMEASRVDLPIQQRIGKVLRVLKWSRENKRIGNRVVKVWRKPKNEECDY